MIRTRTLAASLAVLAVPCVAQDFYDPDTIRSVYLQFSQPDYWTQLTNNYAPEINIAANMTVDGVTYPNVGVRFRGNTSYTQLPPGSQKKSFNIQLDWMVPGQDIQGYDHLNFNNGFHDPTFLREFLSYMVMRRHGLAPKCNFIRLYLNNQLWGLYINVQQPNKDMMKDWFRSNDGNRYRCFPTSGGFSNGRCCFTWLGSLVSSYLSAYQAKQGDGTDLMQMCNVLNNTPTASLQATLPTIFSVDAFYRYAAVMNVLTNTDSYLQSGKDHFLYHDEVHGDFTTFPFDLNEAMAGSTTLDPWYQTTVTTRPAFTKTLQFPDWRQRYKAHVRNVVENSVNAAWLVPRAQQYHAMIAADVAADPKKLYTTAQFTTNLNSPVTITAGVTQTVPGLIPLITGRETFLRNHVDLSAPRTALSNLTHAPVQPNPTQPITFNVTASSHATTVKLYWRRVGPFAATAMFDDGAHGDGVAGDGVFGVVLGAQPAGSLIDYYVEATTATGLATYEPFTAELERNCPHIQIDWPVIPSPIRINEFLAQNVNGIVDELGQHEDWIELYNDSNAPVNVGGMWLSDSLAVLKFQIPANTTIGAFGTLRVWCDEDGTQGPLHANFKLSSTGGESVVLYAASGLGLHDRFDFGPQEADVAEGRVVDGASPWVTLPVPTPGASNTLTTCGTRSYEAIDRTVHGADLALVGAPQIGSSPTFTLANGPVAAVAGFALALAPTVLDLSAYGVGNETLLLDPLSLAVLASPLTDGNGAAQASLAIPANNALVGLKAYGQVLTIAVGGHDTSNAVELMICP